MFFFLVPPVPTQHAILGGSLSLELHYIIIIVVVGLVAIIVVVDLTCYCTRNAGFVACICGSTNKGGDERIAMEPSE